MIYLSFEDLLKKKSFEDDSVSEFGAVAWKM